VPGQQRGIVVACGMNPRFGDFDTYHMAASAIDEAVRNCVAVGANPERIAILDNFCWGNTERPEELGSLVRAALACHDVAVALGTPFISGKDSLNNEFRYTDAQGERQTIRIPPSLLISALGQVEDVRRTVTMDLKEAGNFLYQIGLTRDEMGGSHFALVQSLEGGHVPQVDAALAKRTFAALHAAIAAGLVRACHDLSEGGLAAAAAEMAFAGGLGARLFLAQAPYEIELDAQTRAVGETLKSQVGGVEDFHPLCALPEATAILLFSESNTRFLCEVRPEDQEPFERALADVPHALCGEVLSTAQLQIIGLPAPTPGDEPSDPAELTAPLVIDADLERLKEAWQSPLRW
jgi:phosphoribosylformylglycinamidine synthase